jgi:hypothetical protein
VVFDLEKMNNLLSIILQSPDGCAVVSVAFACKAHPTADVFINFASFRRCALSSHINAF